MSEDGEVSEAERELLVVQYEDMRETIRVSSQQHTRRVLSGMAGVAAVAGYSLFRESEWLFALIPFVIGLMFIQTVNKHRYVASNARHLVEIEERLDDVCSLFCYESVYGGFYGDEPARLRAFPSKWVSWHDVLSYGTLVVAVPTYIFTVYLSVTFWQSPPAGLASLTHDGLLLIYSGFTVFVVAVGVLGWWHKNAVGPTDDDSANQVKST